MAPVQLDVGPVVQIDDAVSSKVVAMVGRRVPRDFIDVAAALGHGYSRAELMRLAFTRDPGLRVVDVADAVRRLDQFGIADFAEYDLDQAAFDVLRRRFADWPRDETDDREGRAVHAAVAEEERRAKQADPKPTGAALAGQAYPPGPMPSEGGHVGPGYPPPHTRQGPAPESPQGREPPPIPLTQRGSQPLMGSGNVTPAGT